MRENEKLMIDNFFGGLLGYIGEQIEKNNMDDRYDIDEITDLLTDYYENFVKNNPNLLNQKMSIKTIRKNLAEARSKGWWIACMYWEIKLDEYYLLNQPK